KPGVYADADLDVSFFGLDERDAAGRPTRDRRLRTVDVHLIRAPKPGRWDFEVEAAYQYGRISADARPGAPVLKVSAGFARLALGYQFGDDWKTRVAGSFDYASGDDDDASFGRF